MTSTVIATTQSGSRYVFLVEEDGVRWIRLPVCGSLSTDGRLAEQSAEGGLRRAVDARRHSVHARRGASRSCRAPTHRDRLLGADALSQPSDSQIAARRPATLRSRTSEEGDPRRTP